MTAQGRIVVAILVVLAPLIVWFVVTQDAVLLGWIVATAWLCFAAAWLGERRRHRG